MINSKSDSVFIVHQNRPSIESYSSKYSRFDKSDSISLMKTEWKRIFYQFRSYHAPYSTEAV